MRTMKFWSGILLSAFVLASCSTVADRINMPAETSGAAAGRNEISPRLGAEAKAAEKTGAEAKADPAQPNGGVTAGVEDASKTGVKPGEAQAANPPSLPAQEKPAGQPPAQGKTAQSKTAQAKPAAAKAELKDDDPVILNLEDVSLQELAEVVFVEMLKKNFQISPGFKTQPKLTVRMTKPILRKHILALVTEILQQQDVLVVERQGSYFLFPVGEIETIEPLFKYGKIKPKPAGEEGLIYQIIPLDYLRLTSLDFIKRFLSKSGTYSNFPQINALILIDFPDRIEKILNILEILDKQIFEELKVQVVKPTYWDPTSLAKQLGELLKIQGIPTYNPQQNMRGVILLPIDRLRELYIFSSTQEWLDMALAHIDNLDMQEAQGGDVRTFIYFPTHSTAKEMGAVFLKIYGESTTSPSETGAGAAGRQAAPQPQAAAAQSQVQGGKRLVVDESRNCLIFIATPTEWTASKDLLDKLDIPVKQVLIEVTIGDLTLDNQFAAGFEWFIKNNNLNIDKKSFTGQGGTEGGLGIGSVGFLYTLTANNNLFRAAINAFMSQNRLKIISSPRIIASDNKPAVINAGIQVPVVTSEAITGQIQQSGTTGLLRSIQYRDTGVILTVTPTIHDGGTVTLDIEQEISEAQTNTISPQIQSPMILNRSIKTTLTARTGQTIFLGGLITKNDSSTKTGVPILSKIPLIGALFKSNSNSERRTEIIILITPHILSETGELDYVSEEFRKEILPEMKKIIIKEIKNEKK